MAKIFLKLAIVLAVVVWLIPMTSPHFDYSSTTTKNIFSMNGPAKSICILCQGRLGHVHGCKGALGGACFTASHTEQFFTRRSKFWSIPFHHIWILTRAFILEQPRCSRCKSVSIFCFREWGMITLPPRVNSLLLPTILLVYCGTLVALLDNSPAIPVGCTS